jgi:hypothetical protein
VGSVVENARILDLPLNGRQVVDLITLSGGATPAVANNGSSRDHFAGVSGFSVAGGLNNGLNYTLDGATHNNPQDNGYLALPFPDALQEFKLETGGTGAQTGMKSSGTVSLVTKSGTNAFHGDLFGATRSNGTSLAEPPAGRSYRTNYSFLEGTRAQRSVRIPQTLPRLFPRRQC